MDGEKRLEIHVSRTLINDYDPVMLKELCKSCSRINSKRSTCYYEKIALLHCFDRIVNVFMIEVLLIKNDVRSYDPSALLAMRNAFLGDDIFKIVFLTAIHAVVSEYGTVQLDNALAACFLVEIINVLRDYRLELALSLEPYQSLVSLIRPCIGIDELTLIEIEKVFRMLHEEVVGDDVDRSVFNSAVRIVDTRTGPEIRDSALSRDTCTAKENDVLRIGNDLPELSQLVFSYCSKSVNPCFHDVFLTILVYAS